MDITHFEVEGETVTLHMEGMPLGTRISSTDVYIAATPLGHPEEISYERQTIVFSVHGATQRGKFGVIIVIGDEQFDAQGSTDYTPSDVQPADTPVVSSVTWKGKNRNERAQRMDTITLSGSHLDKVTSVRVADSIVSGFTVRTRGRLGFLLPAVAKGSTARVYLKTTGIFFFSGKVIEVGE